MWVDCPKCEFKDTCQKYLDSKTISALNTEKAALKCAKGCK